MSYRSTPQLGATAFINVDIALAAGCDSFFPFRYTVANEYGGDDGIDLTEWEAFMGFARRNARVMTISADIICDDEGYVNILVSHEESAKLDAGEYEYDVVLKSPNNHIIRMVEGTVTVSERIAEVS